MSGWSVAALVTALMCDGFFLFASIFRLVMIADVKNDYINPIEYAQRVNLLWWPEVVAYIYVTAIMLICGTWWIFVLHLPMLAYLAYLLISPARMSSRQHRVDPTKVLQGDTTNQQQKAGIVRLVFNIIWFFLYLYLVIVEAINTLGSGPRYKFNDPMAPKI